MKITFWGARGSYPVSAPHCTRYGGNTPCIEITAADTCIIIDAGTGICPLGQSLLKRGVREIHLLISHTHWDHIQGFPYFAPLYCEDVRIHLYSLAHANCSLEQIMSQQQQQPFYPKPLEKASARLKFIELSDGQRWQIGPFDLLCKRLNHPSYTGGFRLEYGGKTFAQISDTDLYGPRLHGEGMDRGSASERKATHLDLQKGAGDLAHRADLMVCDTFFLPEEYQEDWGHSHTDDALRLGRVAKVRKIAFFHHAPHRSDTAIDEIVERYRGQSAGAFEILAAAEGLEVLL
jgi:phosphoribosyl 1,2-cyclic phosphodiesterase